MAEPASYQLTESIARHGIAYGRIKTGTPVRIDAPSIHFDLMDTQDEMRLPQVLIHEYQYAPFEATAMLEPAIPIEDAPDSARRAAGFSLFNGQIQSIGSQYAPSIESKIVTFPDKEQHQLFLEPEGQTTQELYLNGFLLLFRWIFRSPR